MVSVCPSFRKAFPFMRNARETGTTGERARVRDGVTVYGGCDGDGSTYTDGTGRAGFPVGRKRMSVRGSQTVRVSGQSAQNRRTGRRRQRPSHALSHEYPTPRYARGHATHLLPRTLETMQRCGGGGGDNNIFSRPKHEGGVGAALRRTIFLLLFCLSLALSIGRCSS